MHFFALSEAKLEKILKKIAEKFGGKEKSRTFAARLRNNGTKSSLKRLLTVQEASTENTIKFIEKR